MAPNRQLYGLEPSISFLHSGLETDLSRGPRPTAAQGTRLSRVQSRAEEPRGSSPLGTCAVPVGTLYQSWTLWVLTTVTTCLHPLWPQAAVVTSRSVLPGSPIRTPLLAWPSPDSPPCTALAGGNLLHCPWNPAPQASWRCWRLQNPRLRLETAWWPLLQV